MEGNVGIWTLETEGGKDGHRRKVKSSKVPPPQPQREEEQQASGARQHEGL